MQLPYTEVGAGIYRPLLALRLWREAAHALVDGLLDTGADRTLLPTKVARDLGIGVDALTTGVKVRTATGQQVLCKTTSLLFDLVRLPERICWLAEVAIAVEPIQQPHWGFKGFFEFIRADFDGPNRVITLTAGANLPVAAPPA
jgi:hypothetical protein